MAPQLTAMNSASARAPCWCIWRATSSLPVPEAPRIKTGAWLRANFAIAFFNSSRGGRITNNLVLSHWSVASACWGDCGNVKALSTRLRKVFQRYRFGDKVESAAFHRLDGQVNTAVCGYYRRRRIWIMLLDMFDQCDAVHRREASCRSGKESKDSFCSMRVAWL